MTSEQTREKTNEPPPRKKIVRPSTVRAYWLPGVAGITLEAAMSDFINHHGGARLVVSKRVVNGQEYYTFDISKDKLTT